MQSANESISQIITKIRNTDSSIRDTLSKSKDYTRVILLGSTGVSKSSVSNTIIGIPLKVQEDEQGDPYLEATENTPFKMGRLFESETSIPNIYIDEQHKLVICDAPGFDDNRGNSQDLINSFAIDQLFNSPCKIKILFIFSKDESSRSASRGLNVAKNVERLYQIFPNEEELKSSLGVIVSHGDKRDPVKYINSLKQGNLNEKVIKFCDFCIANKETCLFSFPNAQYATGNDQEYLFLDHDRLINFLTNSHTSNPQHKIILSNEAKLEVNDIFNKFGRIEDTIEELIKQCKQIYKINDDNEGITNLNQALSKILDQINQIEVPIDFANIVSENIQSSEIIEENLNKIKCFHNLFSFIKNIDGLSNYFDPATFRKNIRNIIFEEISKNKMINNIKTLEQRNDDVEEKMSNLEKQRSKLIDQLNQLKEKMEHNEKENTEEIERLKEEFREELEHYQDLLDEANSHNELYNMRYLGPFAPFFLLGQRLGEFIRDLLD